MALHLKATGIDFADFSQASGSNWELFDDYEEGDWTPTLSTSHGSGNGSYNMQRGRYTKMGQHVEAFFYCHLTAVGTMSNYPGVTVSTMPFTPKSDNATGGAYIRGGFAFRSNGVDINLLLFNNDNPASADKAYFYTTTGGITTVATGIWAGQFPYITD